MFWSTLKPPHMLSDAFIYHDCKSWRLRWKTKLYSNNNNCNSAVVAYIPLQGQGKDSPINKCVDKVLCSSGPSNKRRNNSRTVLAARCLKPGRSNWTFRVFFSLFCMSLNKDRAYSQMWVHK